MMLAVKLASSAKYHYPKRRQTFVSLSKLARTKLLRTRQWDVVNLNIILSRISWRVRCIFSIKRPSISQEV
ncbi:unnamed protein product [Linum trigynum]|uniref:Uncharacterized protein n=1 Tax=Linum trigynum TaxID=586398 RepID=A0AAV2CYU0_9ROSI